MEGTFSVECGACYSMCRTKTKRSKNSYRSTKLLNSYTKFCFCVVEFYMRGPFFGSVMPGANLNLIHNFFPTVINIIGQ